VRLIDNLSWPNLYKFDLKIVYSEEKPKFYQKILSEANLVSGNYLFLSAKESSLSEENDSEENDSEKKKLTEILNQINKKYETQLSASETISKRREY
jgi:hypothetical protein